MINTRTRIIIDNDFGGDPDGLFQLAHHLLSPSVEVRGIIGSHHYPDGFYGYPGSSAYACSVAHDLLEVMGLDGKFSVYEGASPSLEDASAPVASEAARFIVQEAMRTEVETPLYVVCGAGLTDVATAYLMEPRIGKCLTLVWIGGPEYEGLAVPPPKAQMVEYNLGIDLIAAQVVFNHSDIPVWQVPRDAYRQALVSYTELQRKMNAGGKLGGFLMGRLNDLLTKANGSLGEAYVLGDSPLVLLTALQSGWEADPSSSQYVTVPVPEINAAGSYEKHSEGRQIRVYTRLDMRLMFEDFYAKVAQFGEQKAELGRETARKGPEM